MWHLCINQNSLVLLDHSFYNDFHILWTNLCLCLFPNPSIIDTIPLLCALFLPIILIDYSRQREVFPTGSMRHAKCYHFFNSCCLINYKKAYSYSPLTKMYRSIDYDLRQPTSSLTKEMLIRNRQLLIDFFLRSLKNITLHLPTPKFQKIRLLQTTTKLIEECLVHTFGSIQGNSYWSFKFNRYFWCDRMRKDQPVLQQYTVSITWKILALMYYQIKFLSIVFSIQ